MIGRSLMLLSAQRIWASVPAFAAGFVSLMWTLGTLLPATLETTWDVAVEAYEKQCQNAVDGASWRNQAWTVLAIPEIKRLVATGDIGKGSAKALALAIAQHPELTLVEFESLGGLVHEEDLVIDLIRKHKMDTLVLGRCASACTGVFLAGNRRFVGPDARFGFHQSGYAGRPKDTEWSIVEYETSIFYRERGVKDDFAQQALATSYYALWKPHVDDVKASGFATEWWTQRPVQYR
jgi:hypothetical protein